jgi:hypothetical protein
MRAAPADDRRDGEDYEVKARTTSQYRVTIRREGNQAKQVTRGTAHGVRKLLLLLGPEPWRAYTDKGPDDPWCCGGWECGCGGKTVREESDERRKDIPPVVAVSVERRAVTRTPWERADEFTQEPVIDALGSIA